MFLYRPERIIVDKEVSYEPLTKQICKHFADIPTTFVENYSWHKNDTNVEHLLDPITKGKNTLHLKHFKGNPIKSCPGFSSELVCCNYLTLDLIENCAFECTYCILQAFLNKPVITVHANLNQILEKVLIYTSQKPEVLFRISTGEHSDSLALDHIFSINEHVIRFFAKLPNALLELKTKSKNVEHLLNLPHAGKTLISWSINPDTVIEREEHKTARLHERLNAAKIASESGYKIAFHFDPMICYSGWEKDYQDLVDQIFDTIPQSRISWISLGTLRYISTLKSIVETRFPNSSVFLGEFVKAKDGKMRYLKKIRQRLYRNVQKKINKVAPKVPTYLCMEKNSVWDNTMPYQPRSPEEVEKHLTKKLKNNLL